ncbi:hypothetical protein PVAP13_9KG435085 [Panicum virgatum]|uniref:Cupin type-1 domain-containing protein n=1 Tax=Panicum virgatum TaxID=38727 RepID=A0A8T0NVT3_PANVG|nr:hypothetical protein PVAP13_9KG435085 [Panicum virgatum]
MGRVAVMAAPLLFTLLLLLASRCAPAGAAALRHGSEWGWEEAEVGWRPEEEKERGEGKGLFVLDRVEKVVESEGGQVRVVRGQPWPPSAVWCREGLMHIGFITMEPKTLFVPHYLNSSITLFVRRGKVKVGYIYKDELVERKFKMGDVLHIDAGSTFYMVNTGKGQRLQIICSIDASDSLVFGPPYLSFFLSGAGNPASVLAGFEPKTLAIAFNATYEELARVLLAQTRGPIVYYAAEPGSGGDEERGQGSNGRGARSRERGAAGEEDIDDDARPTWSWRELVNRFIGLGGSGGAAEANRKGKKTGGAPKPFNLYDSKPGFRNAYGWTIAHSDIGVYLVNLTAGSMLAPHVNPRATEYGVVLGGEGTVQVVFPNGSLAMSAAVREGDVFWIPRYFPLLPGGFFGFTTSARRNRPQFLVGAASVLRTMLGPEVAAGFGAHEKDFRELVRAQEAALILPSFPETGKREKGRGKKEEPPLVIEQMAKE